VVLKCLALTAAFDEIRTPGAGNDPIQSLTNSDYTNYPFGFRFDLGIVVGYLENIWAMQP